MVCISRKSCKKAKGDRLGHKFPEPLIINEHFIYVENDI